MCMLAGPEEVSPAWKAHMQWGEIMNEEAFFFPGQTKEQTEGRLQRQGGGLERACVDVYIYIYIWRLTELVPTFLVKNPFFP